MAVARTERRWGCGRKKRTLSQRRDFGSLSALYKASRRAASVEISLAELLETLCFCVLCQRVATSRRGSWRKAHLSCPGSRCRADWEHLRKHLSMNRPTRRLNTTLSASVFPTLKEAFSRGSDLCIPSVMSALSTSSLRCCTQQARPADPFLLADRASSLSGSCSVSCHCAEQVPVSLHASYEPRVNSSGRAVHADGWAK